MERMMRRWKRLTAEEVKNIAAARTPEEYSDGGLAKGPYVQPFAQALVGRTLTFELPDEAPYTCEMKTLHGLFRKQGEDEGTAYYQAHEAEPGVFFIQYALRDRYPVECHTWVADTNTGLVTLCRAKLGGGVEPREVVHSFSFGVISGYESYPVEKHGFTADLVGKAISWVYLPEMEPLKHIYSSEYYYTYVMQGGGRCWMATNPADFVKISDHLYIFSFVEERQAGVQGFFLINTETLTDVGSFFGINSMDQFECYTVGAKGEFAEISTYFTK